MKKTTMAIGTASMIVALCVDSVFVNTLYATFTMEMCWILCGITFAISKGLPPRARAG